MYNQRDINTLQAFVQPAVFTGQLTESAVKSIVDKLNDGLVREEWMSKRDVMAFYGIHEQTYYSWLKRGWLQPYGKGRQARFKKSEVVTLRRRGDV